MGSAFVDMQGLDETGGEHSQKLYQLIVRQLLVLPKLRGAVLFLSSGLPRDFRSRDVGPRDR
jgi:hypothetical protein